MTNNNMALYLEEQRRSRRTEGAKHCRQDGKKTHSRKEW